MSETIQRVRDLIESRLRELNDEAKGLEQAVQSFGRDSASARERHRPGRPSRRKASAGTKRTKRAARGQRRREFLEAVGRKPGDTASSIAKAIGISPSQGYALAGQLEQEGAIKKTGKGYQPAAKAMSMS